MKKLVLRLVSFAVVLLTLPTAPVGAQSSNPIVLENQQPGTAAWDLDLSKVGSDAVGQIKGYASAASVNKGQNITFYVSTNLAQTYTIDVYRVGWYQGLGGRLMQHVAALNGIPQPTCPMDATTGMIACNWAPAYTLATLSSWTSGVYLAILTNAQGYENYIMFTVRDDTRVAALLYQSPVTTNQAYNDYPDDGKTGKSLYDFNSYGAVLKATGYHSAAKVSFDRPYSDSGIDEGFRSDYGEVNFIQWLEQNGYDVTYSTDVDTHANGSTLLNYRGILSMGHDEYWSKPMYDAAVAARDAGVNLAFFGANAVYWQIRFEPSSSGVANRVIVCYRDVNLDPETDPTLKTVNWADPALNRPQQTLIGLGYNDYSSPPQNNKGFFVTYVVNNSANWVYAGAGFKDGDSVIGLVGYEADLYDSTYPSPIAVSGTYTLLSKSPWGTGAHQYSNSSVYQAPSGAWVFATGTMDWNWALSTYGHGYNVVDSRIQQTTANVLNKFVASAGSSAPKPTAPGNLTATAVGSVGANLSWTAATETGGTVSNYLIERCAGAACTTFVQVATSATTTYNDTGLTGSTSYSYRVRASDASNSLGPYSNTASATTAAPTFTAPSNLTAAAASNSQINLAWTAATETGGTITNYLIERCAGAACTTFVQVATSTTTTYNDTGLTAATSYSYRVRATDVSNNLSSYSNATSATTTAVSFTAPSNLTATAAGNTQVNLSWTAATETGGTISNYLIERCAGAACTTFVQVATSATTTYNDTGLTGSTSYSYRVRASDASNNLSGYSNTASATTAAPTFTAPSNLTAAAASSTQINLAWTAATETGGTITNYLIERCSGAACTTFVQVATSTTTTYNNTGLTAATSYSYRVRATDASNNLGPYSNTASATTATVTIIAPSTLTAKASGAAQINLSWKAAKETGGTISNYLIERCSGAACTTFVQVATSTAITYSDTGLTGSTSYSYRVRASDTLNNLSGYSNTASATTAAPTFTAPSNLTAAAASSTQINLTWTAATETGGTISNYLIERCSGAACTTFVQVATSTTTTYNNTGLTAATSYRYRVRATDASNNLGPYSNIASATTSVPTFTAPSNLTATAAGNTQVNLSWTAATETGGTISNYLIERCAGAACTTFVQVATSATTTYNDTGLTGSTSYSYRVRASDASNNLSGYSNTASATTAAPTFTAPSNLTATDSGPGQINLSWTAATETGGTISNYLIERCAGAACTSFVQVTTSTTVTLNNTGLTGSTSYSYRVRATDASNNLSLYSNTASATTTAPTFTAPSNLTATVASNTQINLAWTAATETGGTITLYLIESCQGSGCTNFAQVATSATASYNNTGLLAGTTYTYRVRATDAASNLSPYSNTAAGTTSTAAALPITFVQGNYATPQSSQATVSVTYTAAQAVGDLNVVVVGWNDDTATVTSIVDMSGNVYKLAVGPTILDPYLSQSIYYASNIKAAAAGANIVTVTFSTAAESADIRILEYSGADLNNPVDVAAAASGTTATDTTPTVTTTIPTDLLFAANIVGTATPGPGTGFTTRMITAPDADLVEDRTVTATGSYSATTATLTPAGPWIIQIVAFRTPVVGP